MRCPQCGSDSPPQMRFCGRCGRSLRLPCPGCDFPNPLDYRFCGMCGRPLVEAVPSQQSEQIAAQPTASQLPAALEGDRRMATVLVADVYGSTNLLARLGSEMWVEMMNRVLQILEQEVYRFGGEVDQFRGDGLLAFFGTRVAHEDDPERAILAALAMQQGIRSYAGQLVQEQEIDLRLRIGVNTGEVIVTRIGSQGKHWEDTAMGEAVALAARMEAMAAPGTILVSENCYNLVASRFEWENLGEAMVRGLDEPLAVYRPIAPLLDLAIPHRLNNYGLSAGLIGRQEEFLALERMVHELAAARGGLAILIGEKGIGKAQLVRSVRQHVWRNLPLLQETATPSPLTSLTWLEGNCHSYDQSLPYSLWRELLKNWLGIEQDEPATLTHERLHHQAGLLWGEELDDHFPYLAAFLSLPLEQAAAELIGRLDAEGMRRQFFVTIRSWLERMLGQGPLVLALHELHWADTSSLKLLEFCLPLVDQSPLLYLLILRPERTSEAWDLRYRLETEYPHRLQTFNLASLSQEESREMIAQLIGPALLPAETRDLIVSRAEGNPYYIEELIYSLIEQGVLVQDQQTGQWQAARAVASIELPDTMQSLLLARIDSQPPEGRLLLQMAAVIGAVFWSDVLQALYGDDEQLKEQLTALQRAQLIDERGRHPNLGMEYEFKSQLIRDVAYGSILIRQRIRYHRETVQAMEQLFGREISVQYYGLLAYHCRQAQEWGKELLYTHLAAQQARAIYANDEALTLYTRALELLAEMEKGEVDEDQRYALSSQRFEILSERRELYYLIGELEAAAADARALLPLAEQMADEPVWHLDALLQQPGVAYWTNRDELMVGLARAEEALAIARQLGDRHRQMQCLHIIATQQHFLRDPGWQETEEYALALARHLGDQRYEVRILTRMGTAFAWSDQPERASRYLEAALPVSRALKDKITEAHLVNQLGLEAERQGDYYRLLTEYQQQSLRISREIGYREGESQALIWCGQTQGIYLGDLEGGLALVEQGRHFREGLPRELYALLRLAQLRTLQGELEMGLEMLERGRQVREQDMEAILRAGYHLVSAIVFNALGDEAHLRHSLALTAEASLLVANTPFVTRQYTMAAACQSSVAHLSLATCLADEAEQLSHRQQSLNASQSALDIYRTIGSVQVIECVSEEILFRHSQALAANGLYEEAHHYLQQAHQEMMRKVALIPADTPFRQTFLQNIPLHRELETVYRAQLQVDEIEP